MQFDSKRAYDAIVPHHLKMLPESIVHDLIYSDHASATINTIASIVMTDTGNAETDDNTAALVSALVSSACRWGYDESDRFTKACQSQRDAGFMEINPGRNRDPIYSHTPLVLGEALSERLDRAIEKRLGIDKRGKARWRFSVASGVLRVDFPAPGEIGGSDSYPIASATRDDLSKARAMISEIVLKSGVPSTDHAREYIAKRVAQACSPTICGAWLNLGLFMVSPWEMARREHERQTGDPSAIPDVRPIDDDSVVDCYRAVFDLGPFAIDRVAYLNDRCLTKPEAENHRFEVTRAHEREARKLKSKIDPSLAPCGVCGGDYKEHTRDRVLVVYLKRDASESEARTHLQPLEVAFEADGIDGLIFIDTPEGFRIRDDNGNELTEIRS